MHASPLSMHERGALEFQLSQPFSSSPGCQLFHFFSFEDRHTWDRKVTPVVLSILSVVSSLYATGSPPLLATLTLVSTIYREVRESRSKLNRNTAPKNGYSRWIAYRCQGQTNLSVTSTRRSPFPVFLLEFATFPAGIVSTALHSYDFLLVRLMTPFSIWKLREREREREMERSSFSKFDQSLTGYFKDPKHTRD